jgi:hypothetical protein
VRPTGEILWTTSRKLNYDGQYNYGAINFADIDGDGVPEIIAREFVLNADGSIRWNIGDRGTILWHVVTSYAADLDGDGQQEVIIGGQVYAADGTLLWDSKLGSARSVVVDLDGDGLAEVAFSAGGSLHVFDHLGNKRFQSADLPGGGMAPVAADFDGDGLPEIGIPGRTAFTMIDGDGKIMWSVPMYDGSSIGASAFDFDGDGRAEVIFVDQSMLRIVDGLTGRLIYTENNPSATTSEYSLAADIDLDGHAELLVVSDSGLRAYEAPNDNWAAARPLWNQYDYSTDNLNDDTSVPRRPAQGWLSHNSFRLNTVSSAGSNALPDLAIWDLVLSDSTGAVNVTIANRGMAASPGFEVRLLAGMDEHGRVLDAMRLPALKAGETTTITLRVADLRDIQNGAAQSSSQPKPRTKGSFQTRKAFWFP